MTQQQQQQRQYYIIVSEFTAYYAPLSKDQLQEIKENRFVELGLDAPAYVCLIHPAFLADWAQDGPPGSGYLRTAPVTRLYGVSTVIDATPKAQAAFAKAIKERKKEEEQ